MITTIISLETFFKYTFFSQIWQILGLQDEINGDQSFKSSLQKFFCPYLTNRIITTKAFELVLINQSWVKIRWLHHKNLIILYVTYQVLEHCWNPN